MGLCSRRWPEDNWCCLVAAVVVLIVVAAVGIASWHDAAAVFFGCVRQDVTHDTFIGTSWLRNYRQMWLSGYSALTLETSAPGLPGYYVIQSIHRGSSNFGMACIWRHSRREAQPKSLAKISRTDNRQSALSENGSGRPGFWSPKENQAARIYPICSMYSMYSIEKPTKLGHLWDTCW